MADQTIRLESFPFDSRADGYDDDGYPVYDRAVGALLLRSIFREFFSDGVFPQPADALKIARASSGIAVTVSPGFFIIDGGIGGIPLDSDPVTLTLSASAPQGNTCYGIMLRLDGRSEYRSTYIRVAQGGTGSIPTPPAPDQSTVGVYEYRLGYVVVPNGATDMTGATIHNEKGQAVCPYAAPFEDLDISGIVSDAQEQAELAMEALLSEYEKYKGVIDSALDDSTATYLQQQITELQESQGVDLSGEVDGETVEYTQGTLDSKKYLRVKDASIGPSKLDSTAFTDNPSSSSGVSSKVAATPACVDAKIAAVRNLYVKMVTTSLQAGIGYVNFSGGSFESSGFTRGTDRITAQQDCVVILSMSAMVKDNYDTFFLYINGKLVAEASASTGKDNYLWGTLVTVLRLEQGDYVQVKLEGSDQYTSNDIYTFDIQAV